MKPFFFIKIKIKFLFQNQLTKQDDVATDWAACWRRFEPADHFIFGPVPIIWFNNELVKTPFSSFELKF